MKTKYFLRFSKIITFFGLVGAFKRQAFLTPAAKKLKLKEKTQGTQ